MHYRSSTVLMKLLPGGSMCCSRCPSWGQSFNLAPALALALALPPAPCPYPWPWPLPCLLPLATSPPPPHHHHYHHHHPDPSRATSPLPDHPHNSITRPCAAQHTRHARRGPRTSNAISVSAARIQLTRDGRLRCTAGPTRARLSSVATPMCRQRNWSCLFSRNFRSRLPG